MTRICCLLNYAPHYRLPVFKEMDARLSCDFYFGNDLREQIEKIDYSALRGFKGELRNSYWGNWVWRCGVIALAFRKEYDCYIISGEPHTLSLIPFTLLCLLFGKRVYSWQHGISNPAIDSLKLFNQRLLLSMQRGVFLYGHHAREVMIGLGFSPHKLHVVYNSLDHKRSLSLRLQVISPDFYPSRFANSRPVIVFIGRLTPVKQLPLLVTAFVRLHREGYFCNLVFIGDGEMKQTLQNQLSEAKLTDRVLFVGALYDEKTIASYLSNADVCVSPGNVGLTAIHAHSYGLPVITGDNFSRQMPEFEIINKEGVSGTFFKDGDAVSLFCSLRDWLFHNSFSRDQIRTQCFRNVDHYYTPANQVQVMERVLLASSVRRNGLNKES